LLLSALILVTATAKLITCTDEHPLSKVVNDYDFIILLFYNDKTVSSLNQMHRASALYERD